MTLDFIREFKWWIISGLAVFVLTVVGSVLLLSSIGKDDIDYENRDKRIITNALINAVDGLSVERSEQYYNNLVDRGFLDKSVKDSYFDFNQMSVNTMWGRYDIGANKEISIRLNEKIGENDDGVKNYLTVVSYRYPIDRESLGHDYSGETLGNETYYRVNKVLVSAITPEGKIVKLTLFPEGSIVSNLEEDGLNLEDKHLFDEGLVPVEGDYIEDLINGTIHDSGEQSTETEEGGE